MFFPEKKETIQLPVSPEVFTGIFQKHVKTYNKDKTYIRQDANVLWGEISDSGFTISSLPKQPNEYTPEIIGTIEKASGGMKLFVIFRLSSASKKGLSIWTVFTTAFAVFFMINGQAYIYSLISLGLGIVNYILALEKFKLQTRRRSNLLKKIFSE